jgi:hypothetical protein
MANANAPSTVWNVPNYIGELFLIGATQTPFLSMIGGLSGKSVKVANSFEFALNQNYSLEAAAQPAITETASLTAPTAWSYVRGQEVNTCQIFQEQVSVSYSKQSQTAMLTGLSLAGEPQPVQDEVAFQKAAALEQIALDVEYSFLNGAYQKAINAGVAAKTRGIITASSVNTVAAGGATLSKTLVDELLRTMAGNGAKFKNIHLFANAFQINTLSDEYGYAPQDRTVGGVAVTKILTDFCELTTHYTPQVPAATLLLADLAVCEPVWCAVPGKGVLFYEPLSKTGAGESGQLYGQIGLNYGHAAFHGTITNLATS